MSLVCCASVYFMKLLMLFVTDPIFPLRDWWVALVYCKRYSRGGMDTDQFAELVGGGGGETDWWWLGWRGLC
jgi:hypothetical protein